MKTRNVVFLGERSVKYFSVGLRQKLICREIIPMMKEYSIKRHFITKPTNSATKLTLQGKEKTSRNELPRYPTNT